MSFDRHSLERRENCPLCRSSRRSEQFVLDGFHIVNCADCEFKYVVEVAGEVANKDYYEAGYGGERHRQGQQVNASINIAMLRALGDLRGKRLLDIGSGFGCLLALARDELGMDVCGAEFSASERAWAQEHLGVRTFASVEDIPAGQLFDVVTLFEVIEHVREPVLMFDLATRLLAPEGHLLIGTDNFENKTVQAMGEGFPKWIPNQHISLFAPATLEFLAGLRGRFRPIWRRSYTPWEFFARLAVIRFSGGRYGRKKFSLDQEIGSEFSRGYRFFSFRRRFNAFFARMWRKHSLDGAMMYLALQKV
jgi:2-polyprenyl-3-methyl-5-hydroxy-6-metoxy-1,4-benzoquinol methylase